MFRSGPEYKLNFWFEAIGIGAFGLSWLVKSRAVLAKAQIVEPATH